MLNKIEYVVKSTGEATQRAQNNNLDVIVSYLLNYIHGRSVALQKKTERVNVRAYKLNLKSYVVYSIQMKSYMSY